MSMLEITLADSNYLHIRTLSEKPQGQSDEGRDLIIHLFGLIAGIGMVVINKCGGDELPFVTERKEHESIPKDAWDQIQAKKAEIG